MDTKRKVTLIVSLGSLDVKDVEGGRVNIGIAHSERPKSAGSGTTSRSLPHRTNGKGAGIADG